MSDDWKTQLDALEKEKRRKERAEEEQKETDRKNKFRECHCYICHKASERPMTVHISVWNNMWLPIFTEGPYSANFPKADLDSSGRAILWQWPGDLQCCSKCRNWACKEHSHEGLCEKCAKEALGLR